MVDLLLPALAVPASVGISELAARWWLRSRSEYRVWTPYYRGESRLDPGVFPEFPSPARVIVNREGERAYDVPHDSSRLYRVLVAGGSAAECFLLDQESTWPMLLQRTLERPENLKTLGASRVHVGNIARSGVGAEALALILQRALPCLHGLDAIVIMVGASDAWHWLRAGAPPVIGCETRTASMSKFFGWHPAGPYRWRAKETAIAEIARRTRQLLLRPVRRTTITGRRMLYAISQRRTAREVRTTVQNPEIAVDNFESHFRRAVAIARAHAKRVIVARQPWLRQPRVDKERWEYLWHGAVGDSFHHHVEVFYSTEVVCDVMTRIDASAELVARDSGVESCEFDSTMEQSFDFLHDLFHFTPRGAAAVARVLADVVLRGHGRPRHG